MTRQSGGGTVSLPLLPAPPHPKQVSLPSLPASRAPHLGLANGEAGAGWPWRRLQELRGLEGELLAEVPRPPGFLQPWAITRPQITRRRLCKHLCKPNGICRGPGEAIKIQSAQLTWCPTHMGYSEAGGVGGVEVGVGEGRAVGKGRGHPHYPPATVLLSLSSKFFWNIREF